VDNIVPFGLSKLGWGTRSHQIMSVKTFKAHALENVLAEQTMEGRGVN
jgi:hypothetical protein